MNQYRFTKAAKNQSAAASAVAVLACLVLVAAIVWGYIWLLTFLVNYVLAYFGLKPVTMLLVFVCNLLLGLLGSRLRGTKDES